MLPKYFFSVNMVVFCALSVNEAVAQDTIYSVANELATQSDMKAQFVMGSMYEMGIDIPENDAEAVKWFRKSAEQGYAPAQSKLGDMYARGIGVSENDAEAVKWFRKAAKQGNSFGQASLAGQYMNGVGVSKNHVKAYSWLLLAEAQGEGHAHSIKPWLAGQMTREQIAEAQQISAKCFKNNYAGCD